jgi:hypothetical protein
MKTPDISIRASELMSNITIRVRGLTGLGWRIWAAGKVLRLAGWVLRTPIEVEIGEADKREIRKLALRSGDILIVKMERRLSADEYVRAASHFRSVLDGAGRSDVKCILMDSLASFEILGRHASVAGYQPLTGARAPTNPPNQGGGRKTTDSEKDAALLACIEALDNSAPCYDDYWEARKMAAKAVGVPE